MNAEPFPWMGRCRACGADMTIRNGVRICMNCSPDRWHMNVRDIDEEE